MEAAGLVLELDLDQARLVPELDRARMVSQHTRVLLAVSRVLVLE